VRPPVSDTDSGSPCETTATHNRAVGGYDGEMRTESQAEFEKCMAENQRSVHHDLAFVHSGNLASLRFGIVSRQIALSGADERLRAKAESAILISRMTNEERMQRESNLIATIRKKLPDFARMCADDAELVMLHQDAFAADYQEDEYMLLGMAIKYAGLRGKEVRVIGRNRSTLGEEDKIH
jgi:hypothetical protein